MYHLSNSATEPMQIAEVGYRSNTSHNKVRESNTFSALNYINVNQLHTFRCLNFM